MHLCIDELHVENILAVSQDVHVVRLCATYCRQTIPVASGNNVESPAEQLEHEPASYHAAALATVVFLAPHTAEGYSAISVWVMLPRGNFKGEHCRGVAQENGAHLALGC